MNEVYFFTVFLHIYLQYTGVHNLLNDFIRSYFELEMCDIKICVKYNTANIHSEWP
jgi:hypothetical protein